MDKYSNRTIDRPDSPAPPLPALIEQARQDPRAFGRVYDCYIDPVYRYIYNRVGNSADTEDITAQTFLAALEGIPRYRDNGYFAAWLFSIARRKLVDHYRINSRLADLDEAQFVLGDTDLDGNIIQSERRSALQKLIAALPEHEKELIRLRYLAGLNFAEIARLLKRGEAATKKAFYRLIARIQNQLEVSND